MRGHQNRPLCGYFSTSAGAVRQYLAVNYFRLLIYFLFILLILKFVPFVPPCLVFALIQVTQMVHQVQTKHINYKNKSYTLSHLFIY